MATLTQEQARRALDAGLAKAAEIGSPSSIAIVDAGRNLLAFARMDGALLASIEISQNKAFTARSMNMKTGDIGPLTQPGQPLVVDGEIAGAVGVAGGLVPQDEEVAAAAAASLA